MKRQIIILPGLNFIFYILFITGLTRQTKFPELYAEQLLEHGNSRNNLSLKWLYIRPNKRILSRKDDLLKSDTRLAELCDVLLKVSGGFFQLRFLTSEP